MHVLSIIQKSPLIGLITDESTDINVSRKLIIYIFRYMVYVKAVHSETRKACEFYVQRRIKEFFERGGLPLAIIYSITNFLFSNEII